MLAVRFALVAVPAAFVAVACSEAVPPPSSGAFDLQFQGTSHVSGKQCNIQTHAVKVGEVTTLDLTNLLKDTVANSTVTCAVTANGNGSFHVNAYIRQDPNYLEVDIPEISGANSQTTPATGFLATTSSITQTTFSTPSTEPCQFFVSGTKEQVFGGRAWLSFVCNTVADVSSDKYCAVQTGVIAIQDCDQ